jgi:hypothetical protein
VCVSGPERFHAGQVVAHRDLHASAVWYARAEIVVEDTPDRLLSFWCPGTEVRAPLDPGIDEPMRVPTAPWRLHLRPWHSFYVLSHWRPGDAFSVWLFWHEEAWAFTGWYVNLQSPFVRTEIGFDATDDILDVEIAPDRSWHLKDRDELETAVAAGVLDDDSARSIHSAATRAIDRMERGEDPFTDEWAMWRPAQTWPTPALPPRWNEILPPR